MKARQKIIHSREIGLGLLCFLFLSGYNCYATESATLRLAMISDPPFYLFFTLDALPAGTDESDITLEVSQEGDTPSVSIGPSSLTYNFLKPALLYYRKHDAVENIGTLEWVDKDDFSYSVPSRVKSGIGVFASILHHSEYIYVNKKHTLHRTADGFEVPVWEINIGDPEASFCDLDTFEATMNDSINRLVCGPDEECIAAVGVSWRASLDFQPSQVSIAKSNDPSWKVVTIRAHVPKIQHLVLIPSRESWKCFRHCSESEIDDLYQGLLDHELGHYSIDKKWERGEYGNPAVRGAKIEVPVSGLRNEEIAEVAYNFWFHEYVKPRMREDVGVIHEDYHKSLRDQSEYSSISCKCILGSCERDPRKPKVKCIEREKVYCPCNNPSQGKPRAYWSENECAVECPRGLKCFSVQCTCQ